MSVLEFEAPLRWPDHLSATPRTLQRSDHGFTDMKLSESIQYLEEEVAEIKARGMLSLDIENPRVARMSQRVGGRSGACLHLYRGMEVYVLGCDIWQKPEHNVYSLHLALRSFHNIARWGIAPLEVLLAGMNQNALPLQRSTTKRHALAIEPWMEKMGLGPTATLDDASAVYHRRARALADNEDALLQLNLLMSEAREYFAKDSE